MQLNIKDIDMFTIKHLQMYQITSLNNLERFNMPLNK